MLKNLLGILFLIAISTKSFAQNIYEKGFFIDNKGIKNEGLIKNLDWSKNPKQFEFKTSNDAQSNVLSIKEVKEFEITEKVKYLRAEVDVDLSDDNINALSEDKEPSFTKEEVFLKVLIENTNTHTLYIYNNENIKRFFYMKNGKITPLIYKRYLVSDNKIGTNKQFVEQLKEISNCNNISQAYISNIQYTEKELKNFFIKLNECNNSDYKSFDKKVRKNNFHLSIRPGINFSSFDVTKSSAVNLQNEDFGSKSNFRIGIEAELVLPFNNDKWSVFIEPTYQYFKAEKQIYTSTILNEQVLNKRSINYSSIEIPMGVRYYLFLNEKSKVFLSGALIFDAVMNNSELVYEDYNFVANKIKVSSKVNFGFGVGYKYDRYSVEANFHTNRNLFDSNYESGYNNVSLIFGYTIF